MKIFELTKEPDLALIVAGSMKILVSSQRMFVYPTFKGVVLNPADKTGHAFRAHKDSAASDPYEHPLPHDDPDAMLMLCAAAHDETDRMLEILADTFSAGPEEEKLNGLVKFARAFDYYGGPDELKAAARLAMGQISKEHIREFPRAVVEAAYKFDLEQFFAEITDYISKHEERSVTDQLQSLDLKTNPSSDSLHGKIAAPSRSCDELT